MQADHKSWLSVALGTLTCVASDGDQAVKRLLRNASSSDVTLFEVKGGYHELFMGPEKDLIVQRMSQWILHQSQLKAARTVWE